MRNYRSMPALVGIIALAGCFGEWEEIHRERRDIVICASAPSLAALGKTSATFKYHIRGVHIARGEQPSCESCTSSYDYSHDFASEIQLQLDPSGKGCTLVGLNGGWADFQGGTSVTDGHYLYSPGELQLLSTTLESEEGKLIPTAAEFDSYGNRLVLKFGSSDSFETGSLEELPVALVDLPGPTDEPAVGNISGEALELCVTNPTGGYLEGTLSYQVSAYHPGIADMDPRFCDPEPSPDYEATGLISETHPLVFHSGSECRTVSMVAHHGCLGQEPWYFQPQEMQVESVYFTTKDGKIYLGFEPKNDAGRLIFSLSEKQ